MAKSQGFSCQDCGACCASFRVCFYWRDAEPEDNPTPVPPGTWSDASHSMRVMNGTDVKHGPRCVSLIGRIGKHVHCDIYENRSSTCRDFSPSYQNGVHNPKCDEARKKHGLPPLGRNTQKILAHAPTKDGLGRP
ncbi:MAG: YkgJ family cysteine cluster protein [Bdellovibrionaceae bacterium]|nr:YkgJ family cysteine cluster protein [Pseudobdellovibrionaceae bacterium]